MLMIGFIGIAYPSVRISFRSTEELFRSETQPLKQNRSMGLSQTGNNLKCPLAVLFIPHRKEGIQANLVEGL